MMREVVFNLEVELCDILAQELYRKLTVIDHSLDIVIDAVIILYLQS